MRMWTAAVVVAVASLVAGATAVHLGRSDPKAGSVERRADGPMHVPPAHGGAVTLRTGAVFTDGFEILSVAGDEPATIDSVALVDNGGFELLGAKVASPDRRTGFVQFLHGWPPAGPELKGTRPIDAMGASITPSAAGEPGWELFVGIRVTGTGVLERTGIKVDYTVAGERFTATLPAQLVVCTSRSQEVRGHCPMDT